MESRFNMVGGRSNLFSRRSNRTDGGGGMGGMGMGGYDGMGGGVGGSVGGVVVVGARAGRYDRNRFAKLDLGPETPTLTPESFDPGRGFPKLDLGRLGLYGDGGGGGGGRGFTRYDAPPGPIMSSSSSLTTTPTRSGLLGRIGLSTYSNGTTGNHVGSILDEEPTELNEARNRSDDACEFGLSGTRDNGTYGTRYGGTVGTSSDLTTEALHRGTIGTYNGPHDATSETHFEGTTENDDRIGTYRSETTGTYNGGTHGTGTPGTTYGNGSCVERESPDDVIYYHLIDNYTIFQLETVDESEVVPPLPPPSGLKVTIPPSPLPSSGSTPPSTPSALKPLGLSLTSIRGGTAGDLPVHKKLNLIKNLQILIEELQQKVTRLQMEVEEQDIASSFLSSKFSFNRSKDNSSATTTTCSSTESSDDMKGPFPSSTSSSTPASSSCDVSRCRHLDELEMMKKQNSSLHDEKIHLEEQIVQLRSSKSIIHGTDSEKRVTKLEAENVQLQKQLKQTLDQLRQQQQPAFLREGGGEGGEGVEVELIHRNVASTVQRYESRKKNEVDSKTKDGDHPMFKERLIQTQAGPVSSSTVLSTSSSSSSSSSSSQSPADAAAKHHSHLSTDSKDQQQQQQQPSLSADDAIAMATYERKLLDEISRLPQSVCSADGKGWTTTMDDDEGPEVNSSKHRGGVIGLDVEDGSKISSKDKMETEVRGIRVLCRVRLSLKDEQGQVECVFPTKTTIEPTEPSSSSSSSPSSSSSSSSSSVVQLMYRGRMKSFEVDDIIPATDDSQQRVIDDLRGQLVSCLDGQTVNMIAYGETGSGKTFTIQGTAENPGIVQRTIALLFDEIKRRRTTAATAAAAAAAAATADDGDDHCQLTMSIIEIYNETIRDLLSSDLNQKVDLKPSSDGGAIIPGLTSIHIESGSDATKILKRGQNNRCSKQVAASAAAAADHSSRSHLIITINVIEANRINEKRNHVGRVTLIDLAGSERIEKTGVDAARFKEAQSINKSLTCLGDVLYALLARQTHVPFRSSKLTHLLQDAFIGPNSSTSLIVHIASVEKRASETMSTLMFAQRVRAAAVEPASMASHSAKAGGSSSEGGSGSRTPVEPVSQRPRRPSVSGISDRLSVFERRPSISSEQRKAPPPHPTSHGSGSSSGRRPSAALVSTSAAAASAAAQARERSKSRTENRITGAGSGGGGSGGGGSGGGGSGGGGSGGGGAGTPPPVVSRPRSVMKSLPPTPKKK